MTRHETALRQAGKRIRWVTAVLAMAALGLAIAALRLAVPGYAGPAAFYPVFTAPQGSPRATDDGATAQSCAVRALRLTFDGSTAVLELQNDGNGVVLQAITLGWPLENGALTRIQLDELLLWRGEETSGSFTVFPPLAEIRPYLPPGESARLILTFQDDAQDGAYTLLLDFGDGCYTFFSTLGAGFTVQDNCGLRQLRAVARDNQVLFRLQNVGATATLPVGLTLEWPPDQTLNAVMWGESTLWTGEQTSAPFTIDLREAAIAPLQPGETVALRMVFASPVTVDANADYKVVLTTDAGCRAEFSLLGGMCNVGVGDLEVRDAYATFSLRNDGFYRTQPVLLAIFLPKDAPPLQEIGVGDRSFAPDALSPITVPLRDAPPLEPGESVPVRLGFDGPAPPRGYIIVAQFDRCIAVYSDVQPSAECPVSLDGSPYISGNVFGMRLRNSSEAPVPLETIWFSFPADNSPLHGVNLNDTRLWIGLITTSPATFTAGVNLEPASVPSGTARLEFVFTSPVAPSPYAVELGFPNECRVLYTTRGRNPTPCQVSIPEEQPLAREGNTLWLRIQNGGNVAAELSAVAVRWQESTNGRLLRLTLNDTPIWEGEAAGGTATIAPLSGVQVPLIEPGTTATLGLTFDQTSPDAPYGLLGMIVEFVEGCRVVFEPAFPAPGPVEIDGVIEGLPANVYDGIWKLRVPGFDTLVEIRVTDRTVIEPAGIQPQVGDRVAVTAIAMDSTFLAVQIRVAPRVAEPVEFTGVIEAVDLEGAPPTIQVQGVTVVITETTVINQSPVVGWIAHVIGDRRLDGTVLARRVEVVNPERTQQIEFTGVVDDYIPDCDICEPQQSLWVISGVRVIVDVERTTLHGIAPGEAPQQGAEVLVRGLYQPDDTVLAAELWYGNPDEGILELEGPIYSLPDDPNFLGTWQILNFATNELIAVEVTEETFLVIVDTFPDVGVWVRVRAQKQPDGMLRALRIEILPTSTSS